MSSTQHYANGTPVTTSEDNTNDQVNPLSIFVPSCPDGYEYDTKSESCRKIKTDSGEDYSY